MPIETVGSAEAILCLMSRFQELRGAGPNLQAVWSEIVAYTNQGGKYKFYTLADYDPGKPAGEFLTDLGELAARGYMRPLPDGILEVTALGRCFAFAKKLPGSLLPLEEEINKRALASV